MPHQRSFRLGVDLQVKDVLLKVVSNIINALLCLRLCGHLDWYNLVTTASEDRRRFFLAADLFRPFANLLAERRDYDGCLILSAN